MWAIKLSLKHRNPNMNLFGPKIREKYDLLYNINILRRDVFSFPKRSSRHDGH